MIRKEVSKNYIVQRRQQSIWYDWFMTPNIKEAKKFAKNQIVLCDEEIRIIKWTRTTINEEEEVTF